MNKKIYTILENIFIYISFLWIIYVLMNFNSIYSNLSIYFVKDTVETSIESNSWDKEDLSLNEWLNLYDNSQEIKNSKDYTRFNGEDILIRIKDNLSYLENNNKLDELEKKKKAEELLRKEKERKQAEEEKKKEAEKKKTEEIDFFSLSTELTAEEKEKYWNNSYIVIPKLKVEAPIFYPSIEKENLEDEIMKLLENWVVHRPETQLPYQSWNFFILWHSSNFPWIKSKYSNIFDRIDKMENGDLVYIYYEWRKYVYELYQKDIVEPTQLEVYGYIPGRNLSIMTCYPLGSTSHRLIAKYRLKINN